MNEKELLCLCNVNLVLGEAQAEISGNETKGLEADCGTNPEAVDFARLITKQLNEGAEEEGQSPLGKPYKVCATFTEKTSIIFDHTLLSPRAIRTLKLPRKFCRVLLESFQGRWDSSIHFRYSH